MAKEQIDITLVNNNDNYSGSHSTNPMKLTSDTSEINFPSTSSFPTTSKTNIDDTSLKSNNPSNVSIEDDDSSVIDSDSDADEIVLKSKQELLQHSTFYNSNNNIVPSSLNTVIEGAPKFSSDEHIISTYQKPVIGSIAVQNSSDITFGNKTFYQGPVTIKQFLLDSNDKWKLKENGSVNDGYERDGLPSSTNNTNSDEVKTKQKEDDKNNETYRKYFSLNKRLFVAVTVMSTTALIGIILLIVYLGKGNPKSSEKPKLGDGDDDRKNIPVISSIDEVLSERTNVLRLISRDQWLAQPPNKKLDVQKVPVHRVIIAHTATDVCTTQGQCTFRVRFMQTYHIESRGFDDIGYNFMIGGDGGVYEGRGWDQVGAHTKGFNVDSICIAFIGTFNNITPEPRQLDAAKLLIEKGVELGKIVPDYKLYGHRQFIASESPGEVLFKIIQQWPHWVNTTRNN